MPVQVHVTLRLEDMEYVDGAKLGDLLAKLRELEGVDVAFDAPSADDIEREIALVENDLAAARIAFKLSTRSIDKLSERVSNARAMNRWVRVAEEARAKT